MRTHKGVRMAVVPSSGGKADHSAVNVNIRTEMAKCAVPGAQVKRVVKLCRA